VVVVLPAVVVFPAVVVVPLLAVVVAPLLAVVVVVLFAVVVPWFAVVVAPLFAVVVVPRLAVVAPPPALAPPALAPPGCEAGADACEGAALGAGALLFFCPQAKLGTVIRLRTNSHFAKMLMMGRLDFIVTLLLV
jgi:hypothetical protein